MQPTVVLVHGIRISSTIWRRQLEALEAADVPALAPDLPGHGTRRGEPFTLDGARATIEDAVVRAGRDRPGAPVVVAGLSMGGYLALHWAARTPHPPAALLAAGCTTQPGGVGLPAYRAVARLLGRLPDGGAGTSDLVARIFLPPEARADLEAGGVAVEVMADALAEMGKIDALGDVAGIDTPIWFVNGRWDHFRGHERRFLAAARHGRLVVVPRAHHVVSLVQPVAFNRVLLELTDDVAGRASGTMAP